MTNKNTEPVESEITEDVMEDGEVSFETDFDIDDEFKVAPLVPGGKYEGFVTGCRFSAADNALVWDITLRADEDVFMSDNESPVDGVLLVYKNWFPKIGDENLRTKTGKMSKRQAKINMIQDFSRKMKINMSKPEFIREAISNAEWIGLPVIATVEIREYNGRLSNQIQELIAG
jgi:hypothetical protein